MPLLAGVFGALLIGLAAPRLLASAALLPHDETLARLSRGQPASTEELRAAEAGRKSALRYVEAGRTWSELGAIHIAQARRLDAGNPDRAAYLDRGIRALRRGLAIMPAQPFAWTMLAQATLAGNRATPSVAPILRAAIQTAPQNRRLLITRIGIGLTAWPVLDAVTRDLVAAQVKLAVDRAPVRLANLVRRRYALARVRSLLADDLLRRGRFETVYLNPD